MKISVYTVIFVFTFTLFSCASTQTDFPGKETTVAPPTPNKKSVEEVKSEIIHLLNDTLFSSSFAGISILSIEDSIVLFEYNSRKLFHPASTMKLLTTATAIHTLPSNFRFNTSVSYNGVIQGNTLNSSIYVRGAGDPLLTVDDVDSLAAAIERKGITTIAGDLIGDISLFDTVAWGKGWMWDDEPYSDFPFITPLTVNHNTVTIKLTGGKQTGHEPDISITPTTDMLMMFNDAVTSHDTLIKPATATRVHGTNRFVVSGRIPPRDTSADFTLTVSKPELFFLSLLKDKLAARNIKLTGNAYTVSSPQLNTVELGSVHRGLDTVLQQINKHSDNLAAENLLKTLSAFNTDSSGTAEQGLKLIKDYLAGAGIDTAHMILADGSGTSWYNAVTPDLLTRLLQFEYEKKSTFPLFMGSLSVAGVDGTLKHRLKGTRAEGTFYGKTGTLTGVSTLAGYVTTADGKLLAVSIMTNHFPGKISTVRNLQNTIITLLCEMNLTSP